MAAPVVEARGSRWEELLERLPLGKAQVVMLILFVLSAILMGFSGQKEGQRLTYWCFARTHYDDYVTAKERFEVEHPGWTVDIELVDHNSLVNRLMAAFVRGDGAPDACEIEITGIGRFFKGEPDEVPFEDLEALGARCGDAGWPERVVQARFAPWSYRGHLYGMPQDLHPVVMVYRQDLFAEAGCPDLPAAVATWDDFLRIAKRVSQPEAVDPEHPRYAIALHIKDYWEYWQMLLQRGGGIYDEDRNVVIDSPEAVQVLSYYADLFRVHHVAWPIRDLPSFWAAVKRDEIMAFTAADWFIGFLRNDVPEQAGLWRAMPMPAWEPGGRRVSTFGGTTTVIPRQGPHKEMAWAFTRFLYLDTDETVKRALKTRVMPALHAAYEDPRLLQDSFGYLGDQRLGLLLAGLRNDIPRVYLHSSWTQASAQMRDAIFQTVSGDQSPAGALRLFRLHIEDIVQRYASIEAVQEGRR